MLIAALSIYFAFFATAGATAANLGMFGPFPRDDVLGRTALGAGMGLWISIAWPFYLVGF